MTHFNIDHRTELADRIFVEIDRRIEVCIVRTESGLQIRIYPRTDGALWDMPFATFEVDESEIAALEADMMEE